MSAETLRFLLDLLNRQVINVGAPDFEAACATVMRAKAELQAAVEESAAHG